MKIRTTVGHFLAALAAATTTPAFSAPLPGQIIVDPNNSAWFKYHQGGPFFLASPGDPEDFLFRGNQNGDGTRNGDQDALIQKLSGTGANGIYMQIVRSHGGDGNSTHNPFVNNNPTQGLNSAVLDQWESWFAEMDANGIVIYLFFYDDSASIWSTGSSVGNEERQFFEAIVNRFEHHRHLIWVIAEEYAERFNAARVSALASVIRGADDHDHPIAVHKNNGLSFSEFANDPNIDQFAVQYNTGSASSLHSGMVSAWNGANGRYNLNMSEAAGWGTGAGARQKAWAIALGGAYVMGLTVDIASTPLSDLQDMGRLRGFMESTNFNDMSPRDDLAAADTGYVLADPGTAYIAYGTNVSTIGIQAMTAGAYDLFWFDPVTGSSVNELAVSVIDGTNSFPKPGSIGNEAALYLQRSGDTSSIAPKPPTNVTVD